MGNLTSSCCRSTSHSSQKNRCLAFSSSLPSHTNCLCVFSPFLFTTELNAFSIIFLYISLCMTYLSVCVSICPSVQRMSTVVMQTLAFVQHSSPVPGSQLFIGGDLKLNQRTPLPHRGLHSTYNVSLSKQPQVRC